MPQAYIIIFLLFFAVLAFGWFYWQRAKARGTAEPVADASIDTAPEPPAEANTVTDSSTPQT